MTIHEVGKSISKISTKSSGLDGISGQILQISLPFIVESLTYIYNLSITHNTFPDELKTAKVIPIPKVKDASTPSDHRPISVLPILSKPLERHIHTHLLKFLEHNKLLISLQSGFRPKHSCHTALTHMIEKWLNAVHKKELTGAIFLDLKKAFDMVNHHILLKKLSAYNISPAVVSFFASYLSNRTQSVYSNGKFSNSGIVKHGVPQGSILGPLLFCLFINDMPLCITDPDASCELFADDSTLYVSKTSERQINSILQKSINEIIKWCKDNHMLISPAKTKCMLITTRQKHQNKPQSLQLTLGSDSIEQISKHRILGVIVDEKLSWEPHIDKLCKTLSRNIFLLTKLKQLIKTEHCKLFFSAHIKSHFEYCSTIWDQCDAVHFNKVASLFSRAIKVLSPGPKNLSDKLKELDMLPLRQHLNVNKCIFVHKILNSSAPSYLTSLFHPYIQKHTHNTRNSSARLPLPRLDLNKSSVIFSGLLLWNSLPSAFRTITRTVPFKNIIAKHFSKSK